MIRPTLIGIFLLTLLASIAGPNLALAPPDLTQALAAQEERVAGDPRDPVAWNDLGNLLVVVGRDAEAEQAYRQALDLAPGDPSVRFNLALLMQQDGRVKDAESELRQLLETDPRHAWAHYQLGVILAGRKDRADALDHYARALAYDPSLSFAENNPHIIDNPLFTEALLLSQRHGEPSASRVPRLYGEPERIVQLMLRQHEQTDAAGTTGESSTGDAGGSPPPFEDSPDAAGTPADAARGARRGDPAPASAGTTVIGVPQPAEPGATPPSESAGRRTLTSGQVPSPPGTVQRDPRTQPGGRRPPATRVTPGRTPPPPPPRSSRYIPPSRRSSAQLELELLPEETPERYASATTDPRG